MTDRPETTAGLHLATVVATDDPQGVGRLQVRLPAIDRTLWAAVLVPGGGRGYGVALTPREGETVLVAFESGKLARPYVVGALWSAMERPVDAGPPGQTYAIVSPAGAVLRIDDVARPAITLSADITTRLRIEAGPDGVIAIDHPSASVTLGPDGVTVSTGAKVTISASTIALSAGKVTIDAGLTRISGVVQCDTLIADAVVAASYTPGAGNLL
jgi:uncharacterized protein involved in type VI secretion and phage assembly